MVKAKILVVGPCEVTIYSYSTLQADWVIKFIPCYYKHVNACTQSGKTCISNYLAGATESSGGEYHPTQGVRILEFEVEGESPKTGRMIQAEVELWDCSGSKQ